MKTAFEVLVQVETAWRDYKGDGNTDHTGEKEFKQLWVDSQLQKPDLTRQVRSFLKLMKQQTDVAAFTHRCGVLTDILVIRDNAEVLRDLVADLKSNHAHHDLNQRIAAGTGIIVKGKYHHESIKSILLILNILFPEDTEE